MKKNIALVTGGYSSEAVVSYETAATIEANLNHDLYNVYTIDITREEWWYKRTADGNKIAVDKNDFSVTIDGEKIKFDIAFMAMHGTPGEDGKLLGYFDMLNIPYTSCNALASALTFNKRYGVAVAAFSGISVAKSMHLFRHTPVSLESIMQQLKLPVFVKPNNGGSSLGMSKVNRPEEMASALERAFKEDDQVLIEEFIAGREFTIGLFKDRGKLTMTPITEIKTKKEFFDYEAKYAGAGIMSDEITPAQVDDVIAEKIRAASKKIYDIFDCNGIVRIDFIYNEQADTPYMLEVNTVPGQSPASLVPQQVKAMGWTLKEFYSVLIEDTLNSKHV